MKKLFVGIVLALIPVAVFAATEPLQPPKIWDLNIHGYPNRYYEMECIIPPEMDVIEWLTVPKWADDYERNSWDCSRMAAYTEWVMENCGYPAKIVVGTPTWTDEGHAWVTVKLDGEWQIYEAVSRTIIGPEKYIPSYKDDRNFDEILTLRRYYSSIEDFLLEWGWWIEVNEYYFVLYTRAGQDIRFSEFDFDP